MGNYGVKFFFSIIIRELLVRNEKIVTLTGRQSSGVGPTGMTCLTGVSLGRPLDSAFLVTSKPILLPLLALVTKEVVWKAGATVLMKTKV
jgi:hypothetical protein